MGGSMRQMGGQERDALVLELKMKWQKAGDYTRPLLRST